MLRNLSLGTIVDLRNHDEATRDGIGVLPANGLDYHHFPLLEERGEPPPMEEADIAERLSATYQWIIHNSGELLAQVVTTIDSSRDNAAVFHCSAGKDRTAAQGALEAAVKQLNGTSPSKLSLKKFNSLAKSHRIT